MAEDTDSIAGRLRAPTDSPAALRLKRFSEVATLPRDCPWIDMPDWWDKGLKAWGELLTEQWEAAQAKPLTERQRRRLEMFARAGRALAAQRQEMALKILLGEDE